MYIVHHLRQETQSQGLGVHHHRFEAGLQLTDSCIRPDRLFGISDKGLSECSVVLLSDGIVCHISILGKICSTVASQHLDILIVDRGSEVELDHAEGGILGIINAEHLAIIGGHMLVVSSRLGG